MKKLATITGLALALAALALLVSFIGTGQKKTICRSMKVIIDYNGSEPLILEEELAGYIKAGFDSLPGKKISDIDLMKLETSVNSVDCIRKADVFSSLQGDIVVRAEQRKPLIRVINNSGQSFIIDTEGWLMAHRPDHPVRLPVATGFIAGKYQKEVRLHAFSDYAHSEICDTNDLEVIYHLAIEIASDSFLAAQIDQIFMNRKKEIEFIPKLGRHIIDFGDAADMKDKLRKLKTFYMHGLPDAGWNKYGRISVKFKNQVVCTKK
ncbi:MAG: hypothetical protein JXA03_06800 [Bacteroidales bacterium]|nr:hypothetical protein [Bacteroidales bacterium]